MQKIEDSRTSQTPKGRMSGGALARTALGIDIGGTNLRIAKINAEAEIVDRYSEPVAASRSAFFERIRSLVAKWSEEDVVAVGLGVPGRVDHAARRVLSTGYLDIAGDELGDLVEAAAARPTVIENDCGAALLAELAVGAARDMTHAVMFTVGTGIGGAVAVDKGLLHGRATAGQLGHLTVRHDGRRCNCGRSGCVETTSSGKALEILMTEAGFPSGTRIESLFVARGTRKLAADSVLRTWAAPMRDAVRSMIAAFDPDCVVIGGGLGHAMCRALDRLPSESSWYDCPIVPSALADDAGVIGAGLIAFEAASRTGGRDAG